jgi:LuxR family maltose regulon positive regulatory protein
MPNQILTTKLHIPPRMPKEVLRNDLIDKLNRGVNTKLTLISASAGFGKTTILSQWINTCNKPVAWISLDEEHGDVSHFLIYLIAALQTIIPNLGAGFLAALQSPQPPSPVSVLTFLINGISLLKDKIILVMDDYHLVDSSEVDKAFNFLIENLPEQIHLVLATREDPVFPLAKLRVRGQLNEIRVADLRFTPRETTAFFNKEMKLNLSKDVILILETRTEGWIAGLQLAAISIQGHKDIKGFIKSFSGNHRFVLDYLVEEVLRQQSDDIQNFLLQIAIMDRFCGSICDAVIQSSTVSGQETLKFIERANLFVIPLDDERKWFRFHHLFAELLRQRLNKSEDIDIPTLHKRASLWFEENNFEIEAFKHAAAANDIDRAEILIGGKGMPLFFRGEIAPIYKWLKSLPDSTLKNRPSLILIYSIILTFLGKGRDAELKLLAAEIDILDNKDLIGQIAAIRAMLAIPQNDTEKILIQSILALENLNEDNLAVRTITKWTLGLAYQNRGDRALAIRMFSEVIPISKSSGNIMATIAAATSLGQVQESQNQLFQAKDTYKSILDEIGDPPWPAVCEANLGLARIYYQWNDLDKALKFGELGLTLALQLENIDTPVSCWIFLAQLKLSQKDNTGAATLLSKAEQYLISHNLMFRMNDVAAAQVLILIHLGNFSEAIYLIEKYNLPKSRLRLYITQGNFSKAIELVNTLLKEIEGKEWHIERLQLLIFQALALYGDGQKDKSFQLIKELLPLAESSENIRVFIDESELMSSLLSYTLFRGLTSNFIKKLKMAFDSKDQKNPNQFLMDPLSRRELEVLELINQGLSNGEICEKLFLALDTVKGHNRKIFNKLGVNNRTMAISKARSIHILKFQ